MRRRRILRSPRPPTSIILLIIRIARTRTLRTVVRRLIVVRLGLGVCDVGEIGALDAAAAIVGEETDEEDAGDDWMGRRGRKGSKNGKSMRKDGGRTDGYSDADTNTITGTTMFSTETEDEET